jgi:DNA-binding NtrC family response regulator
MSLLMQNGALYQAPKFNLAHAPRLIRPLKLMERQHIESAMILCQGDLMMAARHLEIARSTLYRKLADYEKADRIVVNLAGEVVMSIQQRVEESHGPRKL